MGRERYRGIGQGRGRDRGDRREWGRGSMGSRRGRGGGEAESTSALDPSGGLGPTCLPPALPGSSVQEAGVGQQGMGSEAPVSPFLSRKLSR